jgi:hypothetical protein
MDIHYKIVGFDRAIGQIIVEFDDWHPMPIDLHLTEQGDYPVGAALDSYIKQFYPSGSIARKKAHIDGIGNAHEIEALLQPATVVSPEPKVAPMAPVDDLFSVLK